MKVLPWVKRATRSAACRASHSSLRASACIDQLALGIDAVAEVRVFKAAIGHELNLPTEERLQAFLQREVGIGILGWRKFVELDKEIEIAGRRIEVGSNGGAENIQPPGTGTSAQVGDLVAVQLN